MDPTARYDPDARALVIGDPVDGVVITDADVLREASRWSTGERGDKVAPSELVGADLGPFVRETVTVGARVLAIASQSADTAAVQQAVKAASEQVDSAVARAAQATDDAARRAAEQIGLTAKHAHETLVAEMTRLVGGENPELLARLQPFMQTVGADLERQVTAGLAKAQESVRLESERRHTELAGLIRDVQKEVAVRVAEETTALAVKEGTTLKGFDYEAALHMVMADIAAGLGDEYVETGNTTGAIPYNKKGDGVLHLSGGVARVVFEAHDGTTKEWGSYLAEAERNRGAAASVGVVKHLSDNAGHAIRVIAPKRVVVAFDPAEDDPTMLRTVVMLMRTVALTAASRSGTEEVITANEHIREALHMLGDLDDAKRSAAAITGHVEKIDKAVTKTATSVRRELDAALVALAGAAAPSLSVVPDAAEGESRDVGEPFGLDAEEVG